MGAQSKQFPFHPSHQINLSPLYWFRKSPSLWIFSVACTTSNIIGKKPQVRGKVQFFKLTLSVWFLPEWFVAGFMLMQHCWTEQCIYTGINAVKALLNTFRLVHITPLSKLSPAWKQKVVINGMLGSIIMLPNSRMQMKAAKKSRIWIWKDFPEFLTKVAAVSVGFN